MRRPPLNEEITRARWKFKSQLQLQLLIYIILRNGAVKVGASSRSELYARGKKSPPAGPGSGVAAPLGGYGETDIGSKPSPPETIRLR